jgi:pimeloyl-ACP methyl ester carboxylesterase
MQVDVVRWLESAFIELTPDRIKRAEEVLQHQPAETIYRHAEAIMRETAAPEHLAAVRRVLDHNIELHLIAGERSAGGWDVPGFVREVARSYTVLPETGHMMMLEDPDAFCQTVRDIILPPADA